MTKRTRIYTRTGDDGTTGLVGGARIAKNAPRIEAYGTVDELSSTIGVARAALRPRCEASARAARLDAWLAWTQDLLFNLGSRLATLDPAARAAAPVVDAGDVAAFERAIDEAEGDLPPLDHFILPGGSAPGAALQVARTVCRRAERLLVGLRELDGPAGGGELRLLNRLSDALFVWSRWINDDDGTPECVWNQSPSPPAPAGPPQPRNERSPQP